MKKGVFSCKKKSVYLLVQVLDFFCWFFFARFRSWKVTIFELSSPHSVVKFSVSVVVIEYPTKQNEKKKNDALFDKTLLKVFGKSEERKHMFAFPVDHKTVKLVRRPIILLLKVVCVTPSKKQKGYCVFHLLHFFHSKLGLYGNFQTWKVWQSTSLQSFVRPCNHQQ